MTREEIIKNLQTIEEDGWNVNAEAIEAVKLAIQALVQEPCEDAIDRSKIGLTDYEILMCGGDYKEALTMLIDKIEKLPSIRPTGKYDDVNKIKELLSAIKAIANNLEDVKDHENIEELCNDIEKVVSSYV